MNRNRTTLVLTTLLAMGALGCLTLSPPSVVSPMPRPDSNNGRLRIVTRPDVQPPQMANARYSPDGAWLIFDVHDDKAGRFLNALNLENFHIHTRPQHAYNGAVFSPKGDLLAFHSEPKSVCVWRLPGPSQMLPLARPLPVNHLLFSEDQTRLAALQDLDAEKSFVTIWDLTSNNVIATLETSSTLVSQMKFSPDGQTLVTYHRPSSSKNPGTSKLQLFDVATGRGQVSVDPGAEWLHDLCFSHDGARLFTLDDKGLQEWSLPSLTPGRRTLIAKSNFDLFYRPMLWTGLRASQGSTLCVQTVGGTFVFDTRENQILKEVRDTSQSAVSASGTTLWILDSKIRQRTIPLTKDSAEPAPVEFSRPVVGPGAHGYPEYFSVASPRNGQVVANLQVLNLTKDAKLEWVGWTAEDAYAGSPGWRKFARPLFRGSRDERPESLTQLQAAIRQPSSLAGVATCPISYEYSPEVAGGDEATIKALVDSVLREPGGWNQMCSFPKSKPQDTLPFFGDYERDWAHDFVSDDNFERLRDGRDGVVREISRRLPSVLKTAPPKPEKVDVLAPLRSPSDVLEVYLAILLDLNGVEALPALLELEQSLDDNSSYPKAFETVVPSNRYSDHVQVLSVITAILANETDKFEGVKTLTLCSPYDKKTRDSIVEMAQDFLTTTPPEQFRGAAGMPLETKYR